VLYRTALPFEASFFSAKETVLANDDHVELDSTLPAHAPKPVYSINVLSKAGYGTKETIRAWCRKGRVPATLSPNGRTWIVDAVKFDRMFSR
jgi:hypothetical protein